MKKKMLRCLFASGVFVWVGVAIVCFVPGCTEQIRAKSFGGKSEQEVPKGQKLVNATWKDSNLWILTRPMRDCEVAETYKFSESSAYGMMQGEITFKESK